MATLKKDDINNELLNEALESLYKKNGAVANDGKIYALTARIAKNMRAPMEGISVKIEKGNFVEFSYKDRVLIIGADKFMYDNQPELPGAIGHELGHSRQKPDSIIQAYKTINYSPAAKRILECEADFMSGKDMQTAINPITINDQPGYYFNPIPTHPSHRERLAASLIKSYIEKNSGVALEVEDVKIEQDCSFTITNQNKLKQISPKIISAAAASAKTILGDLDKEVTDLLDARKYNPDAILGQNPKATSHIKR